MGFVTIVPAIYMRFTFLRISQILHQAQIVEAPSNSGFALRLHFCANEYFSPFKNLG